MVMRVMVVIVTVVVVMVSMCSTNNGDSIDNYGFKGATSFYCIARYTWTVYPGHSSEYCLEKGFQSLHTYMQGQRA